MVMMVTWIGERQEEAQELVEEGMPGDDPRAVSHLRQYWLQAPSTLPYNLGGSSLYVSSMRGDTWSFVHHYVSRLFAGEHDGFFIEAGALDGQMLSNSLWLEQELDWTGLLIEPDTSSYMALISKHRKAWTSNTCLSHTGLTKRSVHVSLTLPPGLRAQGWYMKGSSYQLGVTMKTHRYDSYLRSGEKSFYLVNCFPLHTYLRALNITRIDLLSLDTQGSEMDIIKTIPWAEVKVRVVVVEIVTSKFVSQFVEYMKRFGFVLVAHYNDYVFVQEGDAALTRLRSQAGWQLVVVNQTEEEHTITAKTETVVR
ncbi:Protein Star [Portunus trituberculatus]|uniref:Protein Star n=1 Tax=Portunus trituberculatus TaxID=210409 RepID=A0A5B7EBM0_PORTR|nr:Protein Star [Portunus trituberculatus]